ncbi:PAS domain S-box-containing protein/diguanylate cyclase (GGDEF)-like protein [Idiomarina fontislapidosi]|uniref:diguanylate cyclase n=1 Tax=Idiomarina fontislapidosi TaxID=263723 RepID=A0A432YAS9_9GAMM|nr:diguanylate cyclase [Idiomarina fontislapidosi]PYE35200.1 PAS domain S-box-containing protein/diguanylate cyclase (GGDEF)-like protein [Idiomarina fontislapidosi]RUO58095.1 PAS domain S-box protein [Idiomarina fontislapidosi]
MRIDRVFKKLANTLPFMMAFIDTERRYQFVNERYEQFFDVKFADLKGKLVAEVLGAESYERISQIHSRVLAGEDISLREKVTLRDGRVLQLEIKYVPNQNQRTQQINGFFAIINDITLYASAADVLRAVHDVMNRQTMGLSTDRITKLLKLGCEYLNTDIGIVSRVIDNEYTVKYAWSTGDAIAPGTQFELGNTYCSVTLAASDVIATRNASKSKAFSGHPCYAAFKLETYLGLPIRINGKVWGTLNFSSAASRGAPFTDLDKELMGLLCSAIETLIINNSKTDRLERLAYTDFLTGLSNRLFINEFFERLVYENRERLSQYYCALVDIDHFKRINDEFGHDAGDRVLQAVALEFTDSLRNDDVCARVGGEEFMLLIHADADSDTARLIERLRQSIASLEIQHDQHRISTTVSIGVTKLQETDSFNRAYKRADSALYQSKSNGRNRMSWN